MFYPYKRREQELREGNEALGGKKISPITEEALAYMLMLMTCDRFMPSYIYIAMAHIVEEYAETMDSRSSLLMRSIRYDGQKAGRCDYRGDFSAAEVYLHKEDSAVERAAERYYQCVYPVLRVHRALMDNAESMFCERTDEGRIVAMAVANSLTIPLARAEYGLVNDIDSSHTWPLIIRKKAMRKKNRDAYLYFPKLEEAEIDGLCHAGFNSLSEEMIRRYCTEEGISLIDIEMYRTDGQRLSRDFSNNLRAKCQGWSCCPFIRKMGEDVPEAMEAVQMFCGYMNQSHYEHALMHKFCH